jgi:FtsZ-binding cell division protein ZapB
VAQVFKDYKEVESAPQSIADITKQIRSAKYGSEVRKAMAQGFEMLDDKAYIKYVEAKVDDLKKVVESQTDSNKELASKVDEVVKLIDDLKTSNAEQLKDFDKTWNDKINRIILGIDEPTLERIIDAKLNERGL